MTVHSAYNLREDKGYTGSSGGRAKCNDVPRGDRLHCRDLSGAREDLPYLSLPGVDLYYEDTGGPGTPVVFLHAATGTCDGWVHQLPVFTAAGYRCITYDRRTWGRSRPTDPEHQLGFAGDDLHALVESLSLESVHLVATAAGGITALDYALTHPQRVCSLVAAIPLEACRTSPTWQCSTDSVLPRSRISRWSCVSSGPPIVARTPEGTNN